MAKSSNSSKVTSSRAATAASKTLQSSASKPAKTAAGSALSQKPAGGKKGK
jgi:hypothetical protein